MVKMKRYALLITGALLISLAGCTGTHTPAGEADGTDMASRIVQTAEPEEERSSADENTKTGTESTETAPAAADSEEVAATVEAEEAIRQEEESKTPQISETPAGQQGEPVRESNAAPETPATQTQTPEAQPPQKPEQTSPPAQNEAPREETKPEESEPASAQPEGELAEPAFDVSAWVSFAKSYAQSVGLELDSEATGCWDNPIIASAGSKYLERDLCGMLDKYSRDPDIAAVWIWAEQRTETSWDIFIGYA